jgi:hypothetical protein
MSHTLYRACFGILLTGLASGQTPLTGSWVGTLLQNAGGTGSSFGYRMDLNQATDGSVTGQTTIEVTAQPEYRGVQTVIGQFSGSAFNFQETGLIVNNPVPGTLWCTKQGTLTLTQSQSGDTLTGSWVSPGCVPGTISLTRAAGNFFVPITPCRLMDTRFNQGTSGAFGPPSLGAFQTRNVPVTAGGCGIPSNATAFSLNVTVIPQGPLGYLTLWPNGQTQPAVSTLNSLSGGILANAAIIPSGLLGSINLFATDNTDVILDVNGYFASTGGNLFTAAEPCRLVDTRANSGFGGGFGPPILGGNTSRDFPITSGRCSIPFDATGFSLNATVIPPALPVGFLTLWPTGQLRPVVSTLNALDGTIVANAALVPAGVGGSVSAYVDATSDLLLDINGYFRPSSTPGGLAYYPVTPCRAIDTRELNNGAPIMSAAETRNFPIGGRCGVPIGAKAVAMNVTVIPQGPLGFLTLWAAGNAQPVVSTLNSLLGRILANAAIVPTSSGGQVSVFVTDSTDVVLDVNGYFQ